MGFGEGRNLSAMLWFVPAAAPRRAVAGVLLSVASDLHSSAAVGPLALPACVQLLQTTARRHNPYEHCPPPYD